MAPLSVPARGSPSRPARGRRWGSGLAIGALAGMAWAAPTTAVAQVQADTTTTTVVRPGQSLWDIAEASGTADVPGMVARIAELNDLKGTTIRAGQTLEIPAA